MLKFLGVCLIVFGGTVGGIYASQKLKEHLEQLKTLRRIFIFLKGEITFARSTLPDALEQIARKVEEPFSAFLEGLAHDFQNARNTQAKDIFSKNMHFLKNTQLYNTDLEKLNHAGGFLGFLDRDMQLHTIDLYLQELEEDIQSLYLVMPARKKMYHSIGIMGGLFLAIVLI